MANFDSKCRLPGSIAKHMERKEKDRPSLTTFKKIEQKNLKNSRDGPHSSTSALPIGGWWNQYTCRFVSLVIYPWQAFSVQEIGPRPGLLSLK